ncbi:MAG: DUF2634 domain-containing protein [Firmicutes bacterium HGW-Firmicutes-7]|nr:MAG: DUF2634 domain-containing protein [Firmicutes bacterium HGW-Firmicutes-7]
MIPNSQIDVNLKIMEDFETSRTYKLSDNKIQGYADNLIALEQAIFKVLNTEKFEYPIYSFSYGVELESLIGEDQIYVKIEIKRRIRECLLQDSRIESVDNFKITVNGDQMLCKFDVISIYGELTISKEVNI